jgi:Prohead core protein serine protease
MNKPVKLLIEEVKMEDVETLVETVEGQKWMYIQGPFMKAEVVNGNRRKYPLSVMEAAVEKYKTDYIEDNRAFGELNHPDTPKLNPERYSHLIVDLRREGNDFIGKARLMNTPMGKLVQNIIEAGGKMGVSSRGMGSLKEQNGVNVVQGDFQIATAADIVSDPSAPGAFVQGIMEEKEWIFESGIWREVDLQKAKKSILEAKGDDVETQILRNFKILMSKMTN